MASVVDLRVEHQSGHPLAVDTPTPRLSWRTETDTSGWEQAAWEVDAVDETGKPLWQSDRQQGDASVLVPWRGSPLASRTRCAWRIRVWGTDGSASDWSENAYFEVGLLSPSDWTASMISPVGDVAGCPNFRTSFTLATAPVRARLHITSLGIYDASLNGAPVGDHRLAPGWTAYGSRIHTQTFDVTALLQAGSNRLEAVLANGWYRGQIGFASNRNVYGDRLGLLAQLEVESADGTSLTIGTDPSWDAAPGPTLTAELYDGETYDARIEPGPWEAVEVLDFDFARLVPQPSPPVRVTEVVRPVELVTSPAGKTLIDFGQNLVGVLRLRVEGPAGTTVTLRHAEVLENGEVCTRILRSAKATDRYILRGGGRQEWSPRFTFHGFRYAEVEGWPGELSLDDIDAVVLHTDMRRTGWFECSEPLVNQLHANIVWGWRGNTVSVPTDCPQRDERLGWTGDLQAFSPTACFLYDAAGFLTGWLRDLAADQLPDGRVPPIIPNGMPGLGAYCAGWGDAATVVPTVLYTWFGDRGILSEQLDSMDAWVQSIAERAGPSLLWNNEFQFGDWVDPTVDPLRPWGARTDSGLIATVYFARSAGLTADAAEIVGRDDVAARNRALAAEVRDAARHEWVAPSGRIVSDTQSGCAIALAFALVDDGAERDVVARRLRHLVDFEGYQLTTGFLGTPVLCPALSDAGFVNDAYKLLLQRNAPSWLYPVTVGATTIWERWDALRPDGTLNPGGDMLSFNHYALGAIGEWLHRTVGGLSPVAPGFRRFAVAPKPGLGLTSASVRFDSPYGEIAVSWALAGRGVDMRATVPPNTRAEVTLPGRDGAPIEVGSGTYRWQYAVEADTYRQWVPSTLDLDTTLGELHANPIAWAIVEAHAGEIAGRYSERFAAVPLRRAALGSGLARLTTSPVEAELAKLTVLPDPPQETTTR